MIGPSYRKGCARARAAAALLLLLLLLFEEMQSEPSGAHTEEFWFSFRSVQKVRNRTVVPVFDRQDNTSTNSHC
jgi:hypothetical protein